MRKLSPPSSFSLSSPPAPERTVTCALDAHTKDSELACDACDIKWSMSKGHGRYQARGLQIVGDGRGAASEDDVRRGGGRVHYQINKEGEARERDKNLGLRECLCSSSRGVTVCFFKKLMRLPALLLEEKLTKGNVWPDFKMDNRVNE